MLAVGDQVGPYEVTGTLAHGRSSVVVRARHGVLGTEHALKLLTDPGPAASAALVREGRTQARLEHPNIVRVTDVLEWNGRTVLVQDLVRGPTLAQLLSRVRPTPEVALRLALDVVDGLAAAHAVGVVHRDLKPENVLVDTSEDVPVARVTDFGLAGALTLRGGARGTFGYSAPEVYLDGAPATAASDVFSLGVVVVELLTGTPPFPSDRVESWTAAVYAGWKAGEEIPPHAREVDRKSVV